ncbi:nucleoside triphosphate pyrophosphohydrolase [Peptacetobacter hominis]|uniref:Nucleoside triphosphate pyrophosphohydrolase n=1 Tax=Peptacetobacter hominis TaxID=2743610 RepID=A0A544QTI9_9FIRM|nr:nucleoside triphosphate pyrophosphohydrolase [Peptacetobacter hominis]TQQ84000.1 nucleoside triphosphate pyrophosphohydrolase [Peptacetobacter hominis]
MSRINIIGLGPGDMSLISRGAMDELKKSDRIFLRTEKHPMVDELRKTIKFESLDRFYDENEDFEHVYRNIAEFVVEKAEEGDLVYAVPGHPRVAEKTVGIIESIASEKGIDVVTTPSMSFVDAMFDYLGFDPSEGFRLIDAFELEESYIDSDTALIVTQVYDEFIASNVKLQLMEVYGDEQDVYIVRSAGIKGQEFKKKIKLYELDWKDNSFDYLTSLYIPRSDKKRYNKVHDLELIMAKLRSEDGCDWDKKQTHESLKNSIIEEAYELYNAIENNDIDEMIEELGDVLLQVVFQCQIGKEEGMFDIGEVSEGICKKLITRHPHIFGDAEIDRENFEKTWEDIKKKEKGESTVSEGLRRIPVYLPALMKAEKVQHKAALVGFDWDNIDDVFKKVEEEYSELLDEYRKGNIQYIKEELGDLLFSIVNLARFLEADTTEALNMTTEKFVRRFSFVEDELVKSGKTFNESNLEEMDKLWNQAKDKEKN